MDFVNNIDAKRVIPKVTIKKDLALDEEKAKEYIYNIDFSMLIHKLSIPDANISRVWDPEISEVFIDYYKNFLWLIRKYGKEHVIVPSTEIDEIWHHHILDTYKYHEDCIAIFGSYLHHYPYYGMRGRSDKNDLNNSFEITQELHKKEFGEYIPGVEEEIIETPQ